MKSRFASGRRPCAIILAGGAGRRLAGLGLDLPKPLVPLGDRRLIEHQLALLARYGIRHVTMTTGHGADAFPQLLGDGRRFGVELTFLRESRPLGTAGGVAALHGKLCGPTLVLYGDVLVCMDLDRLLSFHASRAATATLVVHPTDHPHDSDLVIADANDRITRLCPKPRAEQNPDLGNLASAALYVIEPEVVAAILPDTPQDFFADVFPRLLERGANLSAYRTPEYLKDAGTPVRLAEVEADILHGVVEARHFSRLRPTLFLDRDGVLTEARGDVCRPDELVLLPGVASAVREARQRGYLVAVATNQPVIAKGMADEDAVRAVHRRLEGLLAEAGAWLDAIAFCPHHPDRGFTGERPELKIVCACRKPATGLLSELCERLPVDRERSVLVGDTWRDMAAAHAFGIRAIGVRTGDGLRTAAPPSVGQQGTADLVVDDLSAAVACLPPVT